MSRYLAVEGLEGAGKSTVAGRLAAGLSRLGHPVEVVREPGGTEAGEAIRTILLEPASRLEPWTEALLFAAARAQLAVEVVGPALRAGRWVVSDRSVYSSLAYQGLARGLGLETVRAVNVAGLGDVWPDLVVVLQLDPEAGLARQRITDRFGGEDPDFWQKVAAAYRELAAAEPQRIVVVDASRPLEEVMEEVLELVTGRWR